VAGISGATINGDGTMSLILDVPSLVASVKRLATSPHHNTSHRANAQ
jgi:chemotaxis protein histidine kinase CheA